MTHSISLIDSAKRTISLEMQAIEHLKQRINADFEKACQLLLACKGRIVVVGMGKSGHIGRKIAATLASTGSPAFFVHPAEASHGDMGMITQNDVVLAISNSGTTNEVVTLIPLIQRMGIPFITMTGNAQSVMAQSAQVNLDTSVEKEACPLNLAPTSSTTVTLVLGDALAIALLEARGFTAEDFAFSHPGGALGRRLLLRVKDIMHQGDELPCVQPGMELKAALLEMTKKGLGMTLIVDEQNQLAGIFTDGDLRRALDKGIDVRQATIDELMTKGGKFVQPDMLAAQALKIMEDFKISQLPVLDAKQQTIGAITMHDLLRAGVI
ncbi:KpsF/GutQ family sugar-phosphate isomerase [Pseudomonas sp. F1_0610]|uniref:KpsF/GutQ family sugar-phosphate isomerase n=1 Tax=Pseudomonas sp. F1_0610 TaxID=3114284 RepID=UPI0039C2AD1F